MDKGVIVDAITNSQPKTSHGNTPPLPHRKYPHAEGQEQCAASAHLQVDRHSGQSNLTRDFYTLGQYHKWVPTGSRYLKDSGSHPYSNGTGVDYFSSIPDTEWRPRVRDSKQDFMMHFTSLHFTSRYGCLQATEIFFIVAIVFSRLKNAIETTKSSVFSNLLTSKNLLDAQLNS